jgi:predicted thioesterase
MDGLAAEVVLIVGAEDTAIAYGSGDVPVLATPRVLALAEQAAVAAIVASLPAGQTSVGVHAELHHVKATQVGESVRARAQVSDSKGRTVNFDFTVIAGEETVAYGTHKRVVVDRKLFSE